MTQKQYFIILLVTLSVSCVNQRKEVTEKIEAPIVNVEKSEKRLNLSSEFKSYWYNGEAEVSSFELEQARYGEIRNGKAVLIYVTEDFLPKKQVKADNYDDSNIPVLKLNATKKFQTGIYPYSIMQSSFLPLIENSHVLKETASIQEWCGQVYMQLNNRENFEITSHSYFESEADETFQLEKNYTENELWGKLRIDPNSLPTGEIKLIPSLEFSRLKHVDLRVFDANATLEDGTYTIVYPKLERKLTIFFNSEFPFDIIGWEEVTQSGYGANKKAITSKATRLSKIKIDYWSKNSNDDEEYLENLKLEPSN